MYLRGIFQSFHRGTCVTQQSSGLAASPLPIAGQRLREFRVQTPTPARNLPENAYWQPQPGHNYYLIVFGSESKRRLPRFVSGSDRIHADVLGRKRRQSIFNLRMRARNVCGLIFSNTAAP